MDREANYLLSIWLYFPSQLEQGSYVPESSYPDITNSGCVAVTPNDDNLLIRDGESIQISKDFTTAPDEYRYNVGKWIANIAVVPTTSQASSILDTDPHAFITIAGENKVKAINTRNLKVAKEINVGEKTYGDHR